MLVENALTRPPASQLQPSDIGSRRARPDHNHRSAQKRLIGPPSVHSPCSHLKQFGRAGLSFLIAGFVYRFINCSPDLGGPSSHTSHATLGPSSVTPNLPPLFLILSFFLSLLHTRPARWTTRSPCPSSTSSRPVSAPVTSYMRPIAHRRPGAVAGVSEVSALESLSQCEARDS